MDIVSHPVWAGIGKYIDNIKLIKLTRLVYDLGRDW